MVIDLPSFAYDIAQRCVNKSPRPPVIIVGSGASVEFGIPGMPELRKRLLDPRLREQLEGGEVLSKWDEFLSILSDDSDLENALGKVSNPRIINDYVAKTAWELITPYDTSAMEKITRESKKNALSDLLAHVSATSNLLFHVVTTNYDRIIEYAAEMVDNLFHCTGFTYGYRRRMDNDSLSLSLRRGKHSEVKPLRIWKIHGSLDWFSQTKAGSPIVSFPIWDKLPTNEWRPIIVPPGNLKYEQTHNEPYCTMLQGAKSAIAEHSSILAIGFGFNESHIQEKLEAQCRSKDTVIVILAKKLSCNAKNLLKISECRYLAFEECDGQPGICLMHSHENSGKSVKIKGDFWRLSSFMSLITSKESSP